VLHRRENPSASWLRSSEVGTLRLLLLRIVRERMGILQELCSEMLLLSGKLWPPSLHQGLWHWDQEMLRS